MNNDELHEYRIEHEYPTIIFTERSLKDHDNIIRAKAIEVAHAIVLNDYGLDVVELKEYAKQLTSIN
jgi:hypothetical protein